MRTAILAGNLKVGMSWTDTRACLGDLGFISRSGGVGGKSDIWFFNDGIETAHQFF